MKPPPTLDRIDRSGFEKHFIDLIERHSRSANMAVHFIWTRDTVTAHIYDPWEGAYRSTPKIGFGLIPKEFVAPNGY